MNKLERIIVTKTPIAYFVNKSKQWILPGFEGVPLYDVMHFFLPANKSGGPYGTSICNIL
ncbi:MAG: hypothetical protein WDM71_06260 [Ferruginibacter sp.]